MKSNREWNPVQHLAGFLIGEVGGEVSRMVGLLLNWLSDDLIHRSIASFVIGVIQPVGRIGWLEMAILGAGSFIVLKNTTNFTTGMRFGLIPGATSGLWSGLGGWGTLGDLSSPAFFGIIIGHVCLPLVRLGLQFRPTVKATAAGLSLDLMIGLHEMLADMQFEHRKALRENRRWKARWIVLVHCVAIARALTFDRALDALAERARRMVGLRG